LNVGRRFILDADVPAESLPRQRRRLAASVAVAATTELCVLALIAVGIRSAPRPSVPPVRVDSSATPRIVWVHQPGPGGGGGGGGNRTPEPPRRAERPGRDPITVPVAATPAPRPTPIAADVPRVAAIDIPATLLASGQDVLVGSIDAPPQAPTFSQGPGTGGGAGPGSGTGDGDGSGAGLRSGRERGSGGNVYRPGDGTTWPVPLAQPRPNYTADAMRAHLQGSVLLECVVGRDGLVNDVEVIRTLDTVFGLDEEAIKAAKRWRFRPATLMGVPVPVAITIELTFMLR